jgi:DNA-directed RNA polymerase alpha subunit
MEQNKHAGKSVDEINQELENCKCAYCKSLEKELVMREAAETRRIHKLFRKPVTVLDLDVRATHYIYEAHNIRNLADLIDTGESDLLKFKRIGRKSVNTIKEKLKRYGLHLDMNVPTRLLSEEYFDGLVNWRKNGHDHY